MPADGTLGVKEDTHTRVEAGPACELDVALAGLDCYVHSLSLWEGLTPANPAPSSSKKYLTMVPSAWPEMMPLPEGLQ